MIIFKSKELNAFFFDKATNPYFVDCVKGAVLFCCFATTNGEKGIQKRNKKKNKKYK